ncbi:hypothetical protein C0J50_6175 [Silurus asotus]|uniref:SH3 domain-containing protein n=1 Tax=Silurus asotus TaxID=30991 RepID=A0AAD5A3C4_SILAS|nr:hypothetical protein C0J50_6175 [Silurus asotus]
MIPEINRSTKKNNIRNGNKIPGCSCRPAEAQNNPDGHTRRPEITILAAEPLATNSWFTGAPGAFPPAPPPPAQPSWSGSLTVQLPPPSYEQVIREKSREQNTQTSSVAASSSSSSSSSSSPSSSLSSNSSSSAPPRHTTTIATQTDPETLEPQSCTRPQMRRPPKPPRPSLPLAPKPAEPVLMHMHSLIELDEPDPSCSTHTPTHPPGGAQTHFTHTLEPLTPITADSPNITHKSQPQVPVKQEVTGHPRPRPRSKALQHSVIKEEPLDQPETREVKVQTLVRLKDNGTESVFSSFTDNSLDITSNKYFQDLLDVFGYDKQDDCTNEIEKTEKSVEEEKVSTERCLDSTIVCEPSETKTRPEPRPRTQNPKPLVTAKPYNPTPNVEDTRIPLEEQNKPLVHPVPAPRPLVKKVPVSQQQGSSEVKNEPNRLRLPPRPPLAARKSGAFTQEDIVQPGEMPFNSSIRRSSEDQDSSTAASGKPVVLTSSSRGGEKCPAKPQTQRRLQPPKHTPKHTPAQDAVSAVTVTKSGPSPPHHANEAKPLPLRPPPIKSSKSAGSSTRGVKRGPLLPPRPKPGHPLYREYTSKIPPVNTTEIPPSSDPEESYLQKENLLVFLDASSGPTKTPGIPGVGKGQHQDEPLKKEPPTVLQQLETNTSVRYRARFAFDGEDGELTLRTGDVITLTENVNDEWGRGSHNGRTGLFPLNFVELIQESQAETLTLESPELYTEVL